VARVLSGVVTQPLTQLSIRVIGSLRDREATIGGAGKPDRFAFEPLRHTQNLFEHVYGAALGVRAQNFPLATSRKASFSSSASASSRFKRVFCSRSSLSSLAASRSIPP
jgi:hypothetical protein